MNGGIGEQDLRVSNAERDAVVERLQVAYSEGRLEHDELDTRIHLAMTSKTRGDLDTVTRDLVVQRSSGGRAGGLAVEGPVTGEDRMLAALAHGSAIPTLFVGPLALMLLSGRRSPYVRRHAVEAVNFQLTLLLVTVVTFGVGAIVYAVAWVVSLVAAVAGLGGGGFRYPCTWRPVK